MKNGRSKKLLKFLKAWSSNQSQSDSGSNPASPTPQLKSPPIPEIFSGIFAKKEPQVTMLCHKRLDVANEQELVANAVLGEEEARLGDLLRSVLVAVSESRQATNSHDDHRVTS